MYIKYIYYRFLQYIQLPYYFPHKYFKICMIENPDEHFSWIHAVCLKVKPNFHL